MSELLCKDCRHSFRKLSDLPNWGSGYEWRCRKTWVEPVIEDDPVVGPKKVDGYHRRCSHARLHESYPGYCGQDGTLWEPKHKKHLFLQIKHSHTTKEIKDGQSY